MIAFSNKPLTPSELGSQLAKIGHSKRWNSVEEKKEFLKRIGTKGGKNGKGKRKPRHAKAKLPIDK